MPTAWENAQSLIAQQKAKEAKIAQDKAAFEGLVNQIFQERNGFAPSGQGYSASGLDPRLLEARRTALNAYKNINGEGYVPNAYLSSLNSNWYVKGKGAMMGAAGVPQLFRQPVIETPAARPITRPSNAALSPLVAAHQQMRNPWDQTAQQPPPKTQRGQQPQSELNQWVQMTETQGSPMERYLKWRDIYKPNNQGWQDKFQAERERAAAIKAGLLGSWGQLQGQLAGARAQAQSAGVAAAAQRHAADMAHKTAMEQAKMQYAIALQQGGTRK